MLKQKETSELCKPDRNMKTLIRSPNHDPAYDVQKVSTSDEYED